MIKEYMDLGTRIVLKTADSWTTKVSVAAKELQGVRSGRTKWRDEIRSFVRESWNTRPPIREVEMIMLRPP